MTKNKNKETKHSSLIVRWVSIVALTITVSFVIFSVVVYQIVSRQSLDQQEEMSLNVVTTLDRTLSSIPDELEISNVIPSLSPATRRILKGEPAISDKDSTNNAFSDNLIASISNPDINAAVYNKHGEIVFTNGNVTPKFKSFKEVSNKFKSFKEVSKNELVKRNGHQILLTYQKVYSSVNNKLTGYIVVSNNMTYYNSLMKNLLHSMVAISIIAIVVFVVTSYILVFNVVKPIKRMSKVAQEVNADPNSGARIKELNRDDELENLATSINQMLDRMQSYIEQQKQFVGDVSHELRTPVAVIEGHLNMLERWGKDDPQILDESIKASLQEADRMKHLIQEMLDLTRAEQIDVQYPHEVTNVYDTVKRVVADLAMVHPDFEIRLDEDDLPQDTEIQIYHGHLEQLLVILIDNAIKYSTNLKQINVSAGLTKKEVNIIVQDFGEGISKEDQKKIFNRFYRVDKARTREKGGNGLGLSIAHKLVDNYHGEISVESVEGQGSQFKLTFPLISKKKAAKLKKLNENSELPKSNLE
ncbi:Signal transduction histidine-protein kinase ArlS [Lactobacillus helveticus]|nr:Signal transduction histidine-protein kinase ArlS [Lactobacillus helveticus]NRN93358.1 Signal transduction histidine-protein kinase ArlS [Lactobacillus helveticus]NRO05801.1 Signal transduction histidine-protein kinase ArlS [Lactobacillus helveticus]NRO21890.1 Signal transduction histidine-protein kinase ArlS [Lactobacillus helveticus]NRO25942.1 Signal transduction histidine-protein kinase ArlS [Lactobacillus helveticus]